MIERLKRLLPALVTGLTAILALRRVDDFDTWWHLAAGRWIAQHRTLPYTDVLSFTVPDHRWINLQWLYDLELYGLYAVGGTELLVITAALTFSVVIALCIKNMRRALGPVGASAMALWLTAIAQERFSLRPEMVSLVLLQMMLWLIATARRDDGRRLWLLPLIMLVWVNSHSLFIIGVLVIGCHVAGALAAHLPVLPGGWRESSVWTPRATQRVLLSGAAAVLITVVNPYGVDGATFPFKLFAYFESSNPIFQSIGEGRPPFSGYYPTLALRAYQAFFFFSIAVVGVAGLLTALADRGERRGTVPRGARRRASRKDPKTQDSVRGSGHAPGAVQRRGGGFNLTGLLLFTGLAYLSLLARRNMNLFALGVAPFVGQCLLILKFRLPDALRRAWDTTAAGVAVVTPAAVIAMAWFVITNGFYRWNQEIHEFGTGVLEANFPIRASAFIKEMQLPGRLYNDLPTGGYLTWDTPVPEGVYIDGRLPEVYGAAFFSAYSAGLSDPDVWQTDADRFGIRTVLLFHRWENRHQLIAWLLGDARWTWVYFDETAIVFVRREGNEELITQARERFAALSQSLIENLVGPELSWQWPIGRIEALSNYAALLDLMGAPDAAVQAYSRLLDFRLAGESEAQVRVRLAYYYADMGDLSVAREHLARAAEVNPRNQYLPELRARLGG